MTAIYFQDEWVTLYHADNRAILPLLPSGSVGLVLTDPPYAEETHEGARSKTRGKDTKILLDFDAISESDLRLVFGRLSRVCTRWIVSFMDWRHIYGLEKQPPDGLRFVRFGVWTKPNGAPQFTGDRPATGWEAIAIMHRAGGRMRWNGGGHAAVYNHCKIQHPLHKTAKPPALVAKLISQFSDPGDVILDPFGGIGTTAIQAKRFGRRAIVIEMNERYCEVAARALSQGVMDLAEVAA